ncbi:MAG: DUF1467 family protein [Rhizobiales bacterium]|nr:DUF1467 family protein [Hyphomicrobiales bacterium]
MAPLTLFAYYFIFWWLTLFATLSIGLRTQIDEGEVTLGTEASAPAKPRLLKSILLNTVISLIVFGCWYYITQVMGIGIAEVREYFPRRQS